MESGEGGVMELDETEGFLEGNKIVFQQTGSAYICNPPVTDTDIDYICICDGELSQAIDLLTGAGYSVTDYDDEDYPEDSVFITFRKDKINLIVTADEDFYNKFVAATEVAKHLNLLKKSDRVMLFQAVLYGNAP